MSLIKVWRVETLDGEGPYQADLDRVIYKEDMHSPTFLDERSDIHPHPRYDGFDTEGLGYLYDIPQEMSFGFATEESLVKWFFPKRWDAELMEDLELCVRVFEVDEEHVQVGDSQAMFRKDLAREVAEYLPTEYRKTV